MCCKECPDSEPRYAVVLNGAVPTDPDEERVLAEEFGEPTEDGIYGASEVE